MSERVSELVCVYMFIHENTMFTLFVGELTKYNKINIVNKTFLKINKYIKSKIIEVICVRKLRGRELDVMEVCNAHCA